MRRAAALIIMLFVFNLLYAQENEPPEDSPPQDGGDWDIYAQDNYSRGDQTFIISIGAVLPTVFFNNGKYYKNHNFSPPVGGSGSLSYNYYFNRHIFLGGELGGSFLPTLGNNMFYAIFLGARTGYQFYWWRMEFPVNVTIGMTWHRFLSNSYYGLYMKAGGAAYFRFNSEWSFGLGSNWHWLPEWTNDGKKNVDGNMVDILLSARYHF